MERCWVRYSTWSADPAKPAAAGANCLRLSCSPRYAAWGYSIPVVSGAQWWVGAGLVYAGVSGTCGMATLLARLPYNQRT